MIKTDDNCDDGVPSTEPLKGFATAFNTLLSRGCAEPIERDSLGDKQVPTNASSHLPDCPILLEAPEVFEKIEKSKHEANAAKVVRNLRRSRRSAAHVRPSPREDAVFHDRQLKRIATRGVVKLFNTVLEFRKGGIKTFKTGKPGRVKHSSRS